VAGFDVLITALEDTVASVTRNWYVTAAALWRENTRGKERYRLLSWQKKKKSSGPNFRFCQDNYSKLLEIDLFFSLCYNIWGVTKL